VEDDARQAETSLERLLRPGALILEFSTAYFPQHATYVGDSSRKDSFRSQARQELLTYWRRRTLKLPLATGCF
jgi:hypothetical protein